METLKIGEAVPQKKLTPVYVSVLYKIFLFFAFLLGSCCIKYYNMQNFHDNTIIFYLEFSKRAPQSLKKGEMIKTSFQKLGWNFFSFLFATCKEFLVREIYLRLTNSEGLTQRGMKRKSHNVQRKYEKARLKGDLHKTRNNKQ